MVVELLNHLGLDSLWLYGHSMGSIAIETATLLTSRVKGLIVSEPNFHAGGGMFSRAIAAQTEQHFLAQGYDDMLRAETSPWAGSLQSNAPGPSGAAQQAWSRALNLTGNTCSCHCAAR